MNEKTSMRTPLNWPEVCLLGIIIVEVSGFVTRVIRYHEKKLELTLNKESNERKSSEKKRGGLFS